MHEKLISMTYKQLRFKDFRLLKTENSVAFNCKNPQGKLKGKIKKNHRFHPPQNCSYISHENDTGLVKEIVKRQIRNSKRIERISDSFKRQCYKKGKEKYMGSKFSNWNW